MKMPSAMGYLDTSLIQEWGAYPVNGKIWCTLGHYGRIVLQQLFFAVEAVCTVRPVLQTTHRQSKCHKKLFISQLMLCTGSNFGTSI